MIRAYDGQEEEWHGAPLRAPFPWFGLPATGTNDVRVVMPRHGGNMLDLLGHPSETLSEILVKIDGQVIGHITPAGRYLDTVAFRSLGPTARLRAYLGLVAPAARRTGTLARVCGVLSRDVSPFLETDRRHGRIVQPRRGWYALVTQAWARTGRPVGESLYLVK